MIRQAISLDDPCIIDAAGHLLTDASAYPTTVTTAGVTQTPAEQALAGRAAHRRSSRRADRRRCWRCCPGIRRRRRRCRRTRRPTSGWPRAPTTSDASDRAYVANPLQITAPAHGAVFGFIRFISTAPAENYDGFRLDTPINLEGVQEIFFTREGDDVDPNHRGPLFLTSHARAGRSRRRALRADPRRPNGTESGGASLYVDLDSDPDSF